MQEEMECRRKSTFNEQRQNIARGILVQLKCNANKI